MDAVKSESKYERLRKIGVGSYVSVEMHMVTNRRQTGKIVAIKRYSEDDSDPTIRKIAMREVRMLRQLRHPNLINLIEVFRRKRRLHLVFDYCELTVLDVIEKYGNSCPLNLIKKITWQIVNGLSYCHEHNCIHRDIKPENILINQSGIVKICDFGFARFFNSKSLGVAGTHDPISTGSKSISTSSSSSVISTTLGWSKIGAANQHNDKINTKEIDAQKDAGSYVSANKENQQSERQALTEYVATRWYRAPELLIGDVHYDVKIDIWALGCVTAELMRGEPVWPGKTDLDQLCLIKESLGDLVPSQVQTLLSRGLHHQPSIDRFLGGNQQVTDSKSSPKHQRSSYTSSHESIEAKVPSRVGDTGTDFVIACLQMDAMKRPTSVELLSHDYIRSAKMNNFVKNTEGSNATTQDVNVVANYDRDKLDSSPAIRSNSQSIMMLTSTSSRKTNSHSRRRHQDRNNTSSRLPISTNANQSSANMGIGAGHKRKQPTGGRTEASPVIHQTREKRQAPIMFSGPEPNCSTKTLGASKIPGLVNSSCGSAELLQTTNLHKTRTSFLPSLSSGNEMKANVKRTPGNKRAN